MSPPSQSEKSNGLLSQMSRGVTFDSEVGERFEFLCLFFCQICARGNAKNLAAAARIFFLLFPFSEVVIARNLNMQIVDHCRFSGQTARANTQKSRFFTRFLLWGERFFSVVFVGEGSGKFEYLYCGVLACSFFFLEGKLSQ